MIKEKKGLDWKAIFILGLIVGAVLIGVVFSAAEGPVGNPWSDCVFEDGGVQNVQNDLNRFFSVHAYIALCPLIEGELT